MLIQNKLQSFLELVRESSVEELIWMNGYLTGIVAKQPATVPVQEARAAARKITIAYGTETGNSKRLAADFAAKARQKGLQPKLVSLDQYKLTELPKEEYFITIVSTHGDGEPPAAARKFYDHIHNNGFRLEKLKFGVLALGDTAYPLFCKAGEDVDAQLQKLGGQRIVSLKKCDIDFEDEAVEWFGDVIGALDKNDGGAEPAAKVITPSTKRSSRRTKYKGSVLSNINLNDRGSDKQTHHLEIAAENVDYLPGDAAGVIPINAESIVNSIIESAGISPDKEILFRNDKLPVRDLLERKLNIVHLPERVVLQYASIVSQDVPSTKIGLHELLKIYPVTGPEQFEKVLNVLEPSTPRLYSISSSPLAVEDEIHLTVARDQFVVNDAINYGLCSNYLCALLPGTEFEFYIHRNDQFRLPEDDRDIIMIGPGTGIAPFRAFLSHREASGASGRNWLFFGERKFTTDFLYQTEIQAWLEAGVLTSVDLAFSRDQRQKIYVQHRMIEKGKQLFEWLSNGAHLYLCGTKEPMSVDVENTLLYIIKHHGDLTLSAAEDYLLKLKEQGRYVKDVY